MQSTVFHKFVIDTLDNLKGENIIALDVRGKSNITDCMIISTGTSSRHVMALADNLVRQSRQVGVTALSIEGRCSAEWIVVDLGDIIVHVMQKESRDIYELEKLWS